MRGKFGNTRGPGIFVPRRRRSENKTGRDRWLLTYADLITLLLAFFIIMYSMSTVDAKLFGKVSEALSGILHKKSGAILSKFNESYPLPGAGPLKISRFKIILRSLENKAIEKGIDENKFKAEITERGLVIHMMESALFLSGDAKLTSESMELLDLVAEELKDVPNHIRVEGHTDNQLIATRAYPSNWELSSARATAVVRYLSNAHLINPARLSALGYGEYRPRKPNTRVANRASNRRVDIVLLTLELSLKEPSSSFYVPIKGTPAEK